MTRLAKRPLQRKHENRPSKKNAALKAKLQAISKALECPLTLQPLVDPVVIRDGYTYERDVIQTWFGLGNTTSPMTRQSIRRPVCVANRLAVDVLAALN